MICGNNLVITFDFLKTECAPFAFTFETEIKKAVKWIKKINCEKS